MAVQWLTIGSISGPAARHLWETTGQARRARDKDDEIPIDLWNTLIAPTLTAIDEHAHQPPVLSYHRSVDPWLMGDSFMLPFLNLPTRQRRIVGCQRGPESLYLSYQTDWTRWFEQMGQQQRKLSKRDMGHREKSLMFHKLRDACFWCSVLAKKIPAAVFLRRTCISASLSDEQLIPLANQPPAWLAKLPRC